MTHSRISRIWDKDRAIQAGASRSRVVVGQKMRLKIKDARVFVFIKLLFK